MKGALTDGYVAEVARILKAWVREQISVASCGRSLDVLEIGGGDGSLFDSVRDSVSSYVNVEPGRLLLTQRDLARLADPRYMCIKCSAEQIPLQDESVDMVLSIASFDHIPDNRKALEEVVRLLRKNGSFVLTLNNGRSWWKVLLSHTRYLESREMEIANDHYFQWSFAECRSQISDLLTVRKMQTVTFLPFIHHVWRYALPVCDVIGGIFLHRFGANILVVGQKSH
jgi:ubiquinone/menaquinone biosynthesis C-methylase UbiE